MIKSKVEINIQKSEEQCKWELPVYLVSDDGKSLYQIVKQYPNNKYVLIWNGHVQAGTEGDTIEDVLKEYHYLKLVDVSIDVKIR